MDSFVFHLQFFFLHKQLKIIFTKFGFMVMQNRYDELNIFLFVQYGTVDYMDLISGFDLGEGKYG